MSDPFLYYIIHPFDENVHPGVLDVTNTLVNANLAISLDETSISISRKTEVWIFGEQEESPLNIRDREQTPTVFAGTAPYSFQHLLRLILCYLKYEKSIKRIDLADRDGNEIPLIYPTQWCPHLSTTEQDFLDPFLDLIDSVDPIEKVLDSIPSLYF
ncbi:MAG: hypothetical protein OEY38_17760 [Gammaproteobacteria bacterium]|nr:hypothetical protein [Gammaproteobacteria bacterium]